MSTELKARLPFGQMTATGWQNLAIAGLAVFWLAQIAFDVGWGNTLGKFASDFASYWSAGYVANHHGYSAVYNLELMAQTQHPLLPTVANSAFVFHPIPTPYLPVFILPFQLMSLLPPVTGAYIWVTLNFFGTLLYLRQFSIHTCNQPPPTRLLLLLMISAPVFLNLFTGQVNLLLAICVGEYLRLAIEGKPFQSGLWLGGLLLKPQCLILIAPALLLQRHFKTILGLAISTVILFGGSLLLGGVGSISGLSQLWLGYAAGLPTNDVPLMMNWRMIGVQLSAITAPGYAWAIVIVGQVLTVLAALGLWIRPVKVHTPPFFIAVTATFAATGAVAWHSHVPMAMLLIPPLLVLYLTRREVLGNALEWWVFLPAGLYFIRLLLASMMHAGVLPDEVNSLLDLLAGIGLFILNLYLVGWGIYHMRGKDSSRPTLETA